MIKVFKQSHHRSAVLVITVLVGLFSFTMSADAATITVDNGTSTVAVDSSCSIREAIQNANDNAATNADCTAGSGTDTLDIQTDISLDTVDHNAGSSGTDFALPSPSEAIIILGNGHLLEETDPLNALELIDEPEDMTLQDMSIENFSLNSGSSGSGLIECVNSTCRLVLTNVDFSNNTGGIIDSYGSTGTGDWTFTNIIVSNNSSTSGGIIHSGFARNITITDSIFSDNTSSSGIDGGVLTYTGAGSGTIDISNSIFSGNGTNGFGGAIGVSLFGGNTIVNITDTTFEDETAANGGGDLSIEGGDVTLNIDNSLFNGSQANVNGGAVFIQYTVSATITNSTFYGNTAVTGSGGAIYKEQSGIPNGSFHVSHNTFYANSAGSNLGADIFHTPNDADASEFENNIFSGTSDDCAGDFTNISFTNNLSGDSDCGSIATGSGISASLLDNGGSTKTLALLATSNAINNAIAGTLGCPATDARGVGRPSGAGCDIGAYEFVNSTPTDISLSDSFVDEHEPVGEVVADITTTDANAGDAFTYSLACSVPGVDDASFSTSLNRLLSAEVFDYSNKSTYAICIRTTDNAGATYDENFTITIEERSSSSSGSSGGGGPTPPSPTPTPTPVVPTPTPVPPVPTEPVAPTPTPVTDPVNPVSPEPPAPPTNNPPTPPSTPSVNQAPRFENFPKAVGYVLGNAIENIPEGTAETVTIVGVTLPAVAFIVTQPAMAANLATLPIRLWNLIPIWLGLRRRKRPWGTVYDSVTKQPLDPVYVSLHNLSGKEVASTITDMDGRFGFLVPPGRYKIRARKDNYEFPSKKLAGKDTDNLYGSLYDGGEIEISGEESLVIKNIPMDSISFNWNEFEKTNNKKLMKFYSKRDVLIAKIAEIAFWFGLICSLVILYVGSSELNYILFGVYVTVLILRFFGVKPKRPGYVVESLSGFPLSFGLLKIYSAGLQKEVAHAVIGKTGKYYVLVPNGEYYVKIEKKIGEDDYEEVGTTGTFSVNKGFIGKNFEV